MQGTTTEISIGATTLVNYFAYSVKLAVECGLIKVGVGLNAVVGCLRRHAQACLAARLFLGVGGLIGLC